MNSLPATRKTNWFAVWLNIIGGVVLLKTAIMSYLRYRHLAILLGDPNPLVSYLHLNWRSSIFPFAAILFLAVGVYTETKRTTAAIVLNLLPSIAILIIVGASALHFNKMDGESRATFVVWSAFLFIYCVAMIVSYLLILRSNHHETSAI